jgi:hypothetical protein
MRRRRAEGPLPTLRNCCGRRGHRDHFPQSGSTNFESVYNLILSRAIINKVSQEDMPTTLFVFSDMQFNQACSQSYETLFEVIVVPET